MGDANLGRSRRVTDSARCRRRHGVVSQRPDRLSTQAVTYSIYNDDSPAPASPSIATPDNHLQAASITRTTHILIGNEAPYTFNNLGWISDAGDTTAGNNVIAGLDLNPPDGIDSIPSGSSPRVFNFGYNPEVDNPANVAYRAGEVTNMFYWANRFHDLTYQLGFTEAAGNFQQNNFGRGGIGGDPISAQTQDYSGTNNANFTTGPDGGPARMQMYVWTGANPDRSGGLDRDVMLHELTHGLSNRLHANAAGLTTNMSAGMGEGWSDFYARSLAATADENSNAVYTVGGWITNLAVPGYIDNYFYGIRRFPYAPITLLGGPSSRPFNPLTFADADFTDFNISNGAYPRGPFGSAIVDAVHNLGEIWASALFEVRARLMARHGFALGNQRTLQFVTDGMKLDPASPTFLEARDSIIAAATAGGASAAEIGDPALLTSGTYAPTNYEVEGALPAPAPAAPYETALSAFNGTNPNGTWSLYVVDDACGDAGSLSGSPSSLLPRHTISSGLQASSTSRLAPRREW
jgi:extracellular elastinolytic metalloproteinase